MPLLPRIPLAIAALLLLGGCGEAPEPEAPPAVAADVAAAPAAIDWTTCRIDGLPLPVAGRLFVVDGGQPLPDAEPGRETIRRIDILVPGPVSLLLTSPEATAWHVRPSAGTDLRAVFASGDQPQRITGQGLGPRLERSLAFGQSCGRYWLAEGAGPALAEATNEVFGRPHDAIYRMRIDTVVIGGTDPTLDLPEGHRP